MSTFYFLYPNWNLFCLLVVFVPAFLLFVSGSLIRLLSRESLLKILTEIAFALMGIFYPIGLLLVYSAWVNLGSLLFLYSPLLPLIALLLQCMIGCKKSDYFRYGDALALFLLLPFMQVASWSIIFSFLAMLYLFFRSGLSFYFAAFYLAHSLSFFSYKKALDQLGHGLLIANKKGKLLYLNESFASLLSFFQIDAHEKEGAIFEALRWKSFRLADEKSSILHREGHYYLLKEIETPRWKELQLSSVDAEMSLNEQLSAANHDLSKEKTYLLATLDEMKALAQSQEKENLRALVHDSFAEEVSLIHQVLINPSISDLRPLKDLVRRGLSEQDAVYADLPAMEHFYGLLGIRFVNEGPFEACPDKGSVLALIREATDNAIRHGNASEITVKSALKEGKYIVQIANNGKTPEEISLHNGLSHLKALFEKEGGSFQTRLDPSFTLEVALPISKGK